MGNDNENKNYGYAVSIPGIILYAIVYANASAEQFDVLNVNDYWSFILSALYGNIGLLSILFLVGFFRTASEVSNENPFCICMFKITAVLVVGSMIAYILGVFVLSGIVMHNHPKYTIPVYQNYWTKGIMNFTLAEPPIIAKRQLMDHVDHESPLVHLRGGNYIDPNDYLKMYNYSSYDKQMYDFYAKGDYPTNICAQFKISIQELSGGIQYKSHVSDGRKLTSDNSHVIITKHWPFIMSDVLIRMVTGSIILLMILIAAVGTCFGMAAGCGKLFSGGDS